MEVKWQGEYVKGYVSSNELYELYELYEQYELYELSQGDQKIEPGEKSKQ